jgi:hypothetical protein
VINMSPFRIAVSAVTTACFVSVALLFVPAGTAQTGAPAKAVSARRASPRFVDLSRRTLRLLEEQLVTVGTPVIDELLVDDSRRPLQLLREQLVKAGLPRRLGPNSGLRPEGDVESQGLAVEAAKAAYRAAKLSREAAELALKDYTEAGAKQQKSALEEELNVARADHEKAVPRIEQAQARLAKIVPMLNESTGALATRWRLEAAVEIARLDETKTRFLAEGAESKLKTFGEYERLKRMFQLRSEMEQTLSDELARKAAMELAEMRLVALQRARDPRSQLSTRQVRILTLLQQAIPIEEKWSAKLGEMKDDQESSESLRKDIAELTRQFQVIVDEAVAVEHAAAWETFRSKFQRAVGR